MVRSSAGRCGGWGIRTPEGVAPLHAFQACSFGRSDKPPPGSVDGVPGCRPPLPRPERTGQEELTNRSRSVTARVRNPREGYGCARLIPLRGFRPVAPEAWATAVAHAPDREGHLLLTLLTAGASSIDDVMPSRAAR